jgi:hypothetical protein
MAEIETNAGKFKDAAYTESANSVHIELEFHPGKGVDAELFGMVQMVNTIQGGAVQAINPTVKDRSIPAGEAGAGSHIDNFASSTNPQYAASNAKGNKDLSAGTLPSAPSLQFGWHYKSGGTEMTKHAALQDTPSLPGAPANSSQKFETTVLATKGKQAGTYYGSVTWGWEKDSAGKFKKLPLTLKSAGAPSDIFKRAAEVWNTAKSSGGEANIPLPVPGAAAPAAPGGSPKGDKSAG